jgi:hypothetical protein
MNFLWFSAASENLLEDLHKISFCGRHKFVAKSLLPITQYTDIVITTYRTHSCVYNAKINKHTRHNVTL